MSYLPKRPPLDACPVEALVAIVAGKWKARILLELAAERLTFGQLRRGLGRVTQQVLSSQLAGLERDGVVLRTPVGDDPMKGSWYALTDEGRSLLPVLDLMAVWGLARLDRKGLTWAHPAAGTRLAGALAAKRVAHKSRRNLQARSLDGAL